MEVSSLLLEAANLMLTGMVVVFVFLSILIITIKTMSKLLVNFQDAQPVPAKPTLKTNSVPSSHVAAIAAAVKQYRSK